MHTLHISQIARQNRLNFNIAMATPSPLHLGHLLTLFSAGLEMPNGQAPGRTALDSHFLPS